jgi:hypothetical protein
VTYLPSKTSGQNNTVWVSIPWKIGKARDYDLAAEVDPEGEIPDSDSGNNRVKGTLPITMDNQQGGGGTSEEAESLNIILILIIIFIVVMIIGIWMTVNLSRRAKRKGYTEDGEYKPYEETDKAQFDKDEEEEEEPEGGVLAVHDESPYGAKKKDKFMTSLKSMTTMRTIRKTKPIRRSKPLTSLMGEGTPQIDRPHVAGYLPPMSKSGDSTSTASKTTTAQDSDSPSS